MLLNKYNLRLHSLVIKNHNQFKRFKLLTKLFTTPFRILILIFCIFFYTNNKFLFNHIKFNNHFVVINYAVLIFFNRFYFNRLYMIK